MYQRLIEYKKKHNGNTQVMYEQDAKLGEWVSAQRQAYKNTNRNTRMTRKRANLLKSIVFDWDVKAEPRGNPAAAAGADIDTARSTSWDKSWDKMYKRLVVYKGTHNGNTNVPSIYNQDPQLGKWISRQRQAYKNAKMSTERVNLLESIDFDWEIIRGPKSHTVNSVGAVDNSGVPFGAGVKRTTPWKQKIGRAHV